MSQQTISIASEETIEFERVGGSLRVEGWDRQEMQARGDVVGVKRRSGAVVINSTGNLTLSVPRNARLSLGNIGGNVNLENLGGAVELNLVGGDATLSNLTGPVRLQGVLGGELHVENVADLSMNSSKAGGQFNTSEFVRRTAEDATRRAEARIRRAERRAQHITSRVRGPWGEPVVRESQATPASDAPSEQERMAILRMLQDHKITSEQAEKLLAALEGNA
jgi:hypothetical protein